MNIATPIHATTARIDQLKPGHEYPGANINSRTTNRGVDLAQLAASIKQEGLLLPLIVVPDPKDLRAYYVIDGNRRRAAIEQLVKSKDLPKDTVFDIRVEKDLDVATALRKSLAANMHVPLHPVDQFEAFAACLDKGDSAETIAAKYALTEKVVKQRLALAAMSPAVREAWRKGKLKREEAEAYASTSNHQLQEKHLKRGGWESTNASHIRSAMVGNQHEIEKLLKFVGEDAYKAAGGKLVEDLFGPKEGAKIADFGVLNKLAADKLKATAQDYVKKGWGWAAPQSELPRDAAYSWPRNSKPSADDKKKLGVIVDLDYNGKLEIKTGVIKPGTKGVKPNDGRSVPKVKKKTPGLLSNSLAQKLSEQLTYATGNTVAQMPDVALSLALAGLSSSSHGPIRLEERGLATIRGENGTNDEDERPDITRALPSFVKLSTKDKLAALARIVGRAMDFQTQSAEQLPLDEDDAPAIIKLLDGKILNAELRKLFAAEDYFKGVSGDLRLKAIREMDPQQEPAAAKAKKAAQVTIAVQCFSKSKDWLPLELRTTHYAGPAEKKAPAKAKAAKKAKAKPAKKKAR
jgi:ParB family chromosome partitioning protein